MGGVTPPALLIVVAAFAVGCGSSQTLTASEFIDRINGEGVLIELGRQLSTTGGADELYAVRLPPVAGEPKPPAGSEAEPGASGSIYVFEGTGGADDQLEACQASAGLLCFRAANIVVVLDEESSPLEARRLGVAIQRLAD